MDNINNSLLNYREIAKARYEKEMSKKKIDEEERNRIEAELIAKDLELKEKEENERKVVELQNEIEIEYVNNNFNQIKSYFSQIEITNDIFFILHMIESQIETIINLITKHDKIGELHSICSDLVTHLNKYHENKKTDSKTVKDTHDIVNSLFELCGISVDIHLMDTENDLEFAKKMQEEIYKTDIYLNENKIKHDSLYVNDETDED